MVRGALDSFKAQVDKKILGVPSRKEGADVLLGAGVKIMASGD